MMLLKTNISTLLMELSTEEQQILIGGQVSISGEPAPGGQPITPQPIAPQPIAPQPGVSAPGGGTGACDTDGYGGEDFPRRGRRFPIRLSGYLYYR